MRHGWLAWGLLFGLLLGCGEHLVPEPLRPIVPVAKPEVQRGQVQVYFTQPGDQSKAPGNPAEVLARHVANAQKTIDVCAFELDNEVITQALVDAVKRGVQVRLVAESDYLDETGVEQLRLVGANVVDDRRDNALMHNKFMVFDGKAVWTGSMNFTENCAYRNNNHGIFIDDPRIAENYATKFAWMFDQKKFGGAPSRNDRIPNPVVTLADGAVIENYFSTHDRVAEQVIKQIGMAQKSIHFLAFSFTHDDIAEAMLQRARSGVQVQGVFERTQAGGKYSEYDRLRTFGQNVEVYLDANPRNMHHKVIIIDGKATIAGSFNFSANADKNNDENVVILRSPALSQKFEEEFQRIFKAARSAAEAESIASSKR